MGPRRGAAGNVGIESVVSSGNLCNRVGRVGLVSYYGAGRTGYDFFNLVVMPARCLTSVQRERRDLVAAELASHCILKIC